MATLKAKLENLERRLRRSPSAPIRWHAVEFFTDNVNAERLEQEAETEAARLGLPLLVVKKARWA